MLKWPTYEAQPNDPHFNDNENAEGTDASDEDAAHPKGEGEKKKRKRKRKRTDRLTTGEEGPLPQALLDSDVMERAMMLRRTSPNPVAGTPDQNQADVKTAAKRSQPLDFEEKKNGMDGGKGADNRSRILRH